MPPDPGRIDLSLRASGDLSLLVDAESCSVAWTAQGCPGTAELFLEDEPLPVQGDLALGTVEAEKTTHMRFLISIPVDAVPGEDSTTDVEVHAAGYDESHVIPRRTTRMTPTTRIVRTTPAARTIRTTTVVPATITTRAGRTVRVTPMTRTRTKGCPPRAPMPTPRAHSPSAPPSRSAPGSRSSPPTPATAAVPGPARELGNDHTDRAATARPNPGAHTGSTMIRMNRDRQKIVPAPATAATCGASLAGVTAVWEITATSAG